VAPGLAVAFLGIPVPAIVIDDENLGVSIAMPVVFVPLCWLLAFRGGRADGRVPVRTRHSGHSRSRRPGGAFIPPAADGA
jgi:hypothetical protein